MSVSSSSLLVPLTFYPQNSSGTYPPSSLEISYSRSPTWVMKSWGVLGNPLSPTVEVEGSPIGGTVVGSKDGTLYVFNQSRPAASALEPQRPESQLSRPTSPLVRESRATSPASISLTSSPAPFNVTSPVRIVSGVTTEQVEAPKNYVDFDDEPDKLKDMLKGRSPRESKETPNGSDVDLKSHPPSLLEPPSISIKHRSNIKPTPSTTELSSATNSISSLTRDRAFPVHDLTLWCHIIPPGSGPGNAVTSIRLLDNDSIAVLQEMGSVSRRDISEYHSQYVSRDLSIFSLQDGSCLTTVNAEQVHIKPPDGIKDRDVSHDVLIWSHLEVYRVGEVREVSLCSLCLFNMYIYSLRYYLHPLLWISTFHRLPHWTLMIMVSLRNLN